MRSLITRINSHYDNLSKSDQAISDFLIQNIETSAHFSIQELANHVDVSTATISRYAKKLGYKSFQDLKLDIHLSEPTQSDDFFRELTPSDSYKDILTKNFTSNISSLNSTLELISENDLEKAMNILLNASTCGFFGVGGSNAIAGIAFHKFLRMPLKTVFHQDFHYQQMLSSKLTKNDCAFVISHTGKNKDTLRIVEILKNQSVPIIAITSFGSSPLAKLADVALISISEEISFRPEAVTSTVSQISLLDAIFMMYGMKTHDQTEHTIDNIRKIIKETRLKN